MYRLGFTESTLLFFYYLDIFYERKLNNIYCHQQADLFKWLYSTSGFYDKNVTIYDYESILTSNVYNAYFSKVLDSVKKYKGHVTFYFHRLDNRLTGHFNNFFTYINKEYNLIERDNPKYINRELVYNFISNKKVTIINNLGKLMIQQFYSGNLQLIYNDLPEVINIDYIEPSYTFLNDGPHESMLISAEEIYKKIDLKINNTDRFIISSGAYSVLIADYITSNYGKEVLIIGGDLPSFFGINTKRGYMFYKDILEANKEKFIDVPDDMKPKNYKNIEDGCYW
jgi:hypothetical protein